MINKFAICIHGAPQVQEGKIIRETSNYPDLVKNVNTFDKQTCEWVVQWRVYDAVFLEIITHSLSVVQLKIVTAINHPTGKFIVVKSVVCCFYYRESFF